MNLALTLFKNLYATSAHPVEKPWKEWVKEFSSPIISTEDKELLPIFVPGEIAQGEARKNDNVQRVTALTLDIERAQTGFKGDPEGYQARCLEVFSRLTPYEHLAWTTPSSTAKEPRYRVLIPLKAPIPPSSYKEAMAYLNAFTSALGDPGAQKLSQPNIVPGVRPSNSSEWLFAHNEGRLWDADTPLAKEVLSLRASLGEARGRAPKENYLRQACKAVLRGKPYAEDGNRDETALRIALHLARTNPSPSLEAVEETFYWSTVSMGEGAPDAENIQSKIARAAEKFPAPEKQTTEPVRMDDGAPYIVQYKSGYYFRLKNGSYSRVYTKDEVALALEKHLFHFPEVETHYLDSQGKTKKIPTNTLFSKYGELASGVVAKLSAEHSYYDTSESIFYEAVTPRANVVARHHPSIEKWLYELAGNQFESFLDWLSLFADLSRPLSALVVMGPPGVGKNLLAHGLARRLGCKTPASQIALTGGFREELLRCPLVFIDEDIENSTQGRTFLSTIRAEISVTERTVNRKYLPHVEIEGAIRCIIGANHLPFRQKDSSTAEDIEAIAERFHWINGRPEAAEFLKTVSREEKERWKTHSIAEHVKYLEETRKVQGDHRFGVPGDPALADLINLGVDWNSWVVEWVVMGVLDGFKSLDHGNPDSQWGAVIINETVYVRVRAMVKSWHTYLPTGQKTSAETRPIADAVKAVTSRTVRPKNIGLNQLDNRWLFYEIRTSALVLWIRRMGVSSPEEFLAALKKNSEFKPQLVKEET